MICGEDGQYGKLKNNVNQEITVFTGDEIPDEIYVINKRTHQIYFPHGIFADRVMYVTF